MPAEWKEIELGLIYYQKSSSTKVDHFDLKSNGVIVAFVAECKRKKNIQLCIYFAKQTKRKQMVCRSSVIENDTEESLPKKIRV